MDVVSREWDLHGGPGQGCERRSWLRNVEVPNYRICYGTECCQSSVRQSQFKMQLWWDGIPEPCIDYRVPSSLALVFNQFIYLMILCSWHQLIDLDQKPTRWAWLSSLARLWLAATCLERWKLKLDTEKFTIHFKLSSATHYPELKHLALWSRARESLILPSHRNCFCCSLHFPHEAILAWRLDYEQKEKMMKLERPAYDSWRFVAVGIVQELIIRCDARTRLLKHLRTRSRSK